jgi:hypothetical protein
MMDWITQLNANSGAIVAVTATVSAVLTVLLLLESRTTRNLRREAAVEARAKCHPPASFLLELDVKNYGPAIARDLVIVQYLANPDGSPVGEKRRQAETLVSPGEGRRFLPMMANNSSMLNEMAEANLILHVEWSWMDDRRRLWFLPRRHEQKRSWPTADLARDFFGGWALTESDTANDIHEIAEKIRKIEGHEKGQKDALVKGVNTFVRAIDSFNPRMPTPNEPEPSRLDPGLVTSGWRHRLRDVVIRLLS